MMTDDKNGNGMPETGVEIPAPDAADTIPTDAPKDALSEARAEAAQLKDQLLRAMAETENTRRRAQRDREDAQKYGITNFARDVLAVADNLRRALEAIPANSLET